MPPLYGMCFEFGTRGQENRPRVPLIKHRQVFPDGVLVTEDNFGEL